MLAHAVYVDASVYRALQFDWNGRWLGALGDLVQRGLLRLVVTEINKREVAAHLREVWAEASKPVRSSKISLQQMGLDNAARILADENACVGKMIAVFETWLRVHRAWLCKYEPTIQAVLDGYFDGRAPFGTGRKKHEFPDAIVALQLRNWCEATGQKVYVVSQDGDLKSCCSHDGPLVYAPTIAEVVSHATVSVAVHNAVVEAVRESVGILGELKTQAKYLKVSVNPGYIEHALVTVDVQDVEMIDAEIEDVTVFKFEANVMECAAWLYCELRLRADVDQEAVQHGEDDWELGWHHTQTIRARVPLPATVTARLVSADPIKIEIEEVGLDENRVRIDWDDVARELW